MSPIHSHNPLSPPATWAGWLVCLVLMACGPRASLTLTAEGCSEQHPCRLGEGSIGRLDFVLTGADDVTATVRSADESVVRPYNLREDTVHFAAEGVGRTSVELGVSEGGGEPTVVHFEVAELADLGLVVGTAAPLVAQESYGFAIAPVDGSGRALDLSGLLRTDLTCTQTTCRIVLSEGRHSLWNGTEASPIAVRAIQADRIHWTLDGHTLTYGLAAGEQLLQVPDHPSISVETKAGGCQLEESSVVGTSWVMRIAPQREGVPCTLSIAPTVSGRLEGVQAVTVPVDG